MKTTSRLLLCHSTETPLTMFPPKSTGTPDKMNGSRDLTFISAPTLVEIELTCADLAERDQGRSGRTPERLGGVTPRPWGV
jgi:hypothetical protein